MDSTDDKRVRITNPKELDEALSTVLKYEHPCIVDTLIAADILVAGTKSVNS